MPRTISPPRAGARKRRRSSFSLRLAFPILCLLLSACLPSVPARAVAHSPELPPNLLHVWSAALIEALLALDYKLFWHLPMYYSTANYYGNSQNPFGRLVSANMLGIHASLATNIQGMKPVTSPQSDWRKA